MWLVGQRKIRAAVNDLDQHTPTPWSIDGLVANLAAARGRPIVIFPWTFPTGPNTPSGLWIPTEQTDAIFYDRTAFLGRRDGAIGHEVGHIVLNHTPRLAQAPDELLSALFPSLRPSIARRVLTLARTGYDTDEEAAAEDFGTRLIERGTNKRPSSGSNELGRLTDIL